MIIKYKIRKTQNVRGENNGVLCFDYVKKLSQNFPAMSLEIFNQDRELGYFNILLTLINSSDLNQEKYILGYYSEFQSLQDDNRIIRYKGYWNLKGSLNNKDIQFPPKKYNFLKNKKEFMIYFGNKIRMKGIAYLDLDNKNEIEELIRSVSYKIDRGFFFLVEKDKLNEFETIINQAEYSQCIDFILNKLGLVFILLGEEDFKMSEIVAISNYNIIKNIISNLESNTKIELVPA